jgi:fatty-acyl-CoA synthase
MRLRQKIKREMRFLKGLSRTLKRVKSIAPDSTNLICDDLETAVDKWRDRQAITFEGKTITYAELDALANRYAHWAKGQGLTRGQTVALFMPNRLEYMAIWYGLNEGRRGDGPDQQPADRRGPGALPEHLPGPALHRRSPRPRPASRM